MLENTGMSSTFYQIFWKKFDVKFGNFSEALERP